MNKRFPAKLSFARDGSTRTPCSWFHLDPWTAMTSHHYQAIPFLKKYIDIDHLCIFCCMVMSGLVLWLRYILMMFNFIDLCQWIGWLVGVSVFLAPSENICGLVTISQASICFPKSDDNTQWHIHLINFNIIHRCGWKMLHCWMFGTMSHLLTLQDFKDKLHAW